MPLTELYGYPAKESAELSRRRQHLFEAAAEAAKVTEDPETDGTGLTTFSISTNGKASSVTIADSFLWEGDLSPDDWIPALGRALLKACR